VKLCQKLGDVLFLTRGVMVTLDRIHAIKINNTTVQLQHSTIISRYTHTHTLGFCLPDPFSRVIPGQVTPG